MPGQLWEECSKRSCDSEPVCADCFYCNRHCTCADDREAEQFAREVNRRHPGFFADLIRHQEDGAREH